MPANRIVSTDVPDALTASAKRRPPGVPKDLWRAYGDMYPGGPKRERKRQEEARYYREGRLPAEADERRRESEQNGVERR